MTENTIQLTDPARELAELCVILAVPSKIAGDEHLARCFEVEAWSAEFYQIVFCIVERAENLIAIIKELELDDDYEAEAITHLKRIQAAFNKNSLVQAWNSQGCGAYFLSPDNVQPLKMLSPQVRKRVSYARLADSDISDLLDATAEFEGWLLQHQLAEQDFVRQSLLDGIKQFRFRLTKIRWLGWGYTFGSLREVIAAYKLLESNIVEFDPDPNAEAILKKGLSFFIKIFSKVGVAKDTVERADFLLRAYGAINLVQQGTSVVGLLTHLKG